MTIIEMRQKRAALVKQARGILDKASAEKRSMTAEETQEYEKIFTEADGMGEQVRRLERQEAAETELSASAPTGEARNQDPAGNADPAGETPEQRKAKDETKKMDALRRYFRGGIQALTAEEHRALQVDDPTLGGYLQAPQKFVADLLKGLDDEVMIRQNATIHTLEKAATLGVPTLDTDAADAEWTSELLTGSEDTSIRIGKRELKPNPLAKRIKVSNTLLRVGAIDVETLIMNRLNYKFGITMEKGYLTGNGSGQPLGLFVASDDGIPTSRDSSEDMEATNRTADGLINAKFTLKAKYYAKSKWLFHRDAVKRIRKLKDGMGQYLWVPGLVKNSQDTLLDSPVMISENVPNTFTTGLYVGLYGDFKYYWIVDCLSLTMQRLVELYAETNQTGFIGRYEGDGQPVLAEAFVRVKMG